MSGFAPTDHLPHGRLPYPVAPDGTPLAPKTPILPTKPKVLPKIRP